MEGEGGVIRVKLIFKNPNSHLCEVVDAAFGCQDLAGWQQAALRGGGVELTGDLQGGVCRQNDMCDKRNLKLLKGWLVVLSACLLSACPATSFIA